MVLRRLLPQTAPRLSAGALPLVPGQLLPQARAALPADVLPLVPLLAGRILLRALPGDLPGVADDTHNRTYPFEQQMTKRLLPLD